MKKYKIGITVGVFDIFHIGHLNLLKNCKKHCDYLIVAVCDDDYVKNIKNKIPIFNEKERVKICKAIKYVDKVVLVNIKEIEDKIKLFEKYNFNVLFSGDDWKGSNRYKKTIQDFKKYDIKIKYFSYTQGISTSKIKEIIDRNKV